MHMDFRHVDVHKIGLFAKSMKQLFINCNYPNSLSHTHAHTFNNTDTRFTFQKLIIIVFMGAKK